MEGSCRGLKLCNNLVFSWTEENTKNLLQYGRVRVEILIDHIRNKRPKRYPLSSNLLWGAVKFIRFKLMRNVSLYFDVIISGTCMEAHSPTALPTWNIFPNCVANISKNTHIQSESWMLVIILVKISTRCECKI